LQLSYYNFYLSWRKLTIIDNIAIAIKHQILKKVSLNIRNNLVTLVLIAIHIVFS
jgi:hypothetical protein